MRTDSQAARIGRQKGQILKHAIAVEVLGITGENKDMAKMAGKTIIYRRWLPYGATTTSATTINQVVVDHLDHQAEEGVTPEADDLIPHDVSVTMQQYHCLYSYTDQVEDLYEDDIPAAMREQTGERMGQVREMIRYGVLKACTNKFYAGGTSRSTVDERITLAFLRNITRSLQANHAKQVTSVLAPAAAYATAPVEASYLVFCHTDCEQDIRDLPGFIPTPNYGQRKTVHEQELGSCERFRFVTSPELRPIANAGASVGSTGLNSTGGSTIDVYPIIVVAKDAWGDVALRGSKSLDPTHIKPGTKDTADPLGQRGYVGAKFYSAAVITNEGWMACGEAGVTDL